MVNISYLEDLNVIEISFDYDLELVDLVKTIPGKRWIPERKKWQVPSGSLESIFKTFHGYELNVDPRLSEQIQNRPKINALTISEINSKISLAIQKSFPSHVWVVGEIFDHHEDKVRSKHKFFKIIEKDPSTHGTLAEVNAVIWENYYSLVEEKISKSPKPFELKNGIEVMFLAQIQFRGKTGTISLNIIDIDPVYTIGKMAENREKILAELSRMNLINKNLSIPMPSFARRIGVISSLSSAGYQDFVNEIINSKMDFIITVHHANVQGKNLVNSILTALNYFSKNALAYDCLTIIRGGGSSADLVEFDSKELAMAVANCPVKIVCGIGHERDKTVLDHLTLSLKTPTKVASFLIETLRNDYSKMEDSFEKINFLFARKLQRYKDFLFQIQARISKIFIHLIHSQKSILETNKKILSSTLLFILNNNKNKINNHILELKRSFKNNIRVINSRLDNYRSISESNHPKKILKRGYTYITKSFDKKKYIKRRTQLAEDQSINIHFFDGIAEVEIKNIKHEETK